MCAIIREKVVSQTARLTLLFLDPLSIGLTFCFDLCFNLIIIIIGNSFACQLILSFVLTSFSGRLDAGG